MFSGTLRTRDGCRFGDGRAQGDRHQRLRPRLGRPARAGRAGADREALGPRRDPGSATRSARRDDARRAPLRPADARDGRRSAASDDRGALHVALTQLAEQDPLINLRQDDIRQELFRLALRRGAEGGHPGDAGDRLRHRRRVPRDDDDLHRAARRHGRGRRDARRGSNPFLATVGLRVEPAPVDTGVEFRLEVELGSMPLAFFRAVEDTVRETLRPGHPRLAGHRLRRHDDALRLLAAVLNGRGLPQPDAARVDERADGSTVRSFASRSIASTSSHLRARSATCCRRLPGWTPSRISRRSEARRA